MQKVAERAHPDRQRIADRTQVNRQITADNAHADRKRNTYRGHADSQRFAERAYEDMYSIPDRPCRQKSVANKANDRQRVQIECESDKQSKNCKQRTWHTEHKQTDRVLPTDVTLAD
jgi:hypothetical protein